MTNQRETAVVWDRETGRPSQRHRLAGHPHRLDRKALDPTAEATSSGASAGLPPATYFSGGKVQWMLENVDGLRAAAERATPFRHP